MPASVVPGPIYRDMKTDAEQRFNSPAYPVVGLSETRSLFECATIERNALKSSVENQKIAPDRNNYTHIDLADSSATADEMFHGSVCADICSRSSIQVRLVVGESEPRSCVVVCLIKCQIEGGIGRRAAHHQIPEGEGLVHLRNNKIGVVVCPSGDGSRKLICRRIAFLGRQSVKCGSQRGEKIGESLPLRRRRVLEVNIPFVDVSETMGSM